MKEVAVMATENSAKELAYKTRERLTGKTKKFIENTIIKPFKEWISWNRSLAMAGRRRRQSAGTVHDERYSKKCCEKGSGWRSRREGRKRSC